MPEFPEYLYVTIEIEPAMMRSMQYYSSNKDKFRSQNTLDLRHYPNDQAAIEDHKNIRGFLKDKLFAVYRFNPEDASLTLVHREDSRVAK